MAEISAAVVKALRDQTGAGMMECKKALGDARGDEARAIVLLRERGLAKAVKRAGRATSEGTIALATAGGAAGIIELGCETDFVAKTDDFVAVATALAEGGRVASRGEDAGRAARARATAGARCASRCRPRAGSSARTSS